MLRRSSRIRERAPGNAVWLQAPSDSRVQLQTQSASRLLSQTTSSSSVSPGTKVNLSSPQHDQHMSERRAATPSLSGMTRVRNGKRYRLQVVQHPERARMCGFGDKDRRPLSPSLIVKLVVIDDKSGETVSPWNVNTSLFFLAADLCHPDDLILAPRNLLVHQHAASVPSSMMQSNTTSQASSASARQSHTSSTPTAMERKPPPPPPPPPSQQPHVEAIRRQPFSAAADSSDKFAQTEAQTSQRQSPPSSTVTTITMEHYTRNLVGAAVTSANVLRDENDEYCIFFVLQDLSVRTEGVYRIRLVFTDLAQQDGDTNVNVSEALAEAYTDPFTVFSPRRFPGMLEPTELSKKLAAQGIKIAVRSDKKKRRRQSADEGAGSRATVASASSSGGGQGSRTAAEYDAEMDELDDDDD